jgi:hypothetical protein
MVKMLSLVRHLQTVLPPESRTWRSVKPAALRGQVGHEQQRKEERTTWANRHTAPGFHDFHLPYIPLPNEESVKA